METLSPSTPLRVPFQAFCPAAEQQQPGSAPGQEFASERVTDYFVAADDRVVEPAVTDLLLPQSEKRWFNPLVFHGPSGTGKTHLALGLSHWMRTMRPRPGGLVTTGPDWARAYAAALEEDTLVAWRDQCRQALFFVLDDVHRLFRKYAAQRELSSLLDDLIATNVPCIVTCRVNPLAASELVPELSGRLAAGLTIALHPLDPVARRAYLEQLALDQGWEITPAGLGLIAQSLSGTVPELRAAFWKLVQHLPKDRRIDVLEIRRVLRDQQPDEQAVALSVVIAAVAKYFQVSRAKLIGTSRRRGVAHARCIAIFLARQLSKTTLKGIGAHFGGRDHTTVLHAYRKVEELLDSDPATQTAVAALTQQLTKGRGSFHS